MSDDVRDTQITQYRRTRSKSPKAQQTLDQVAANIKGGTYKDVIAQLRAILRKDGPDAYRKAKADTLPAWTFGATFTGPHKRNPEMRPTGLACIDLDDLEDAGATPAEVIAKARNHPNVVLATTSPSDDGVKAVVRLDPIPELTIEMSQAGEVRSDRLDAEYQQAYNIVAAHLAREWEVPTSNDRKCKDISRLCFATDDPDAHYNPDATPFKWQDAIKERNDALKELKSKFAPPPECNLDHESDIPIPSQLAEAVKDRLRYVDDAFHYSLDNIPVWQPTNTRAHHINGILQAARICPDCRRRINEALLVIEARDRNLSLQRHATFYVDGEVWCVQPCVGAGIGRLRPAEYADLLRFEPQIAIPRPGGDEWRYDEPVIVTEIMRKSWCQGGRNVDWVRRFLSRALDGPQRRYPFVLGYPSTGKNVFQEALAQALPDKSTQTISGRVMERYVTHLLMTSILVFADDAQNIPDEGWDIMQPLAGMARGVRRGMHMLDSSKPSESSLMLFAEASWMRFTNKFIRGKGWDHRIAYLLNEFPGDDHEADDRFATRLLTSDNIAHLAQWIITGDNDNILENTRRTPDMAMVAYEVHEAAAKEVNGKDVPTRIRDENGNPIDATEEEMTTDKRHEAKQATANAIREIEDADAKPTPGAVMAKLIAMGITNAHGGKLTLATTRNLIKDTQSDPNYH